jgi:hypothetical protein
MRPLVIENGRIRQLRDTDTLTGVQRFIEGENVTFAVNPVNGTTSISASGGGSGGVSYIDGGLPSSNYGGIANIDGGGV